MILCDAVAQAGMTGADPGAQTSVSAQQVGGGGQSLSTVPVPNMAATCPSILEEVTKANLDGAHRYIPVHLKLRPRSNLPITSG
jgi:hypothetical protein